MDGLFGVRVAGPLTPHAVGFAVELARVGYTPLSRRDQLALVAHFSRWLESEGLDVTDAAEAAVAVFLVARRAADYRAHLNAKSLVPLLAYLRGLELLPPAQVAPLTPGGRCSSASVTICWPSGASHPQPRAATWIWSARSCPAGSVSCVWIASW